MLFLYIINGTWIVAQISNVILRNIFIPN